MQERPQPVVLWAVAKPGQAWWGELWQEEGSARAEAAHQGLPDECVVRAVITPLE